MLNDTIFLFTEKFLYDIFWSVSSASSSPRSFSRPYLSNCKPPFSLENKEEKSKQQNKKTKKKQKRKVRETYMHISAQITYTHTLTKSK